MIRRLNNYLKDYFTFTQKERYGIFILIIILILLCTCLFVMNFIPQDHTEDYSRYEKEIAEFEKSLMDDTNEIEVSSFMREDKIFTDKLKKTAKLFPFNPNLISDEQWAELGLNEGQVRTIRNYLNKGGKFFDKEDLKKIYSIDEDDYARLEPYIVIPDDSSGRKHREPSAATYDRYKRSFSLDLNASAAEDFEKLPGIGLKISSNIIKYRNLLGGFVRKEQLKEVFGFSDSLYEATEKYFTLRAAPRLQTININNASEEELHHPYISRGLSAAIVTYRKQHGKFSSADDIKKIKIVNDSIFMRIRPYLDVK